MIDSHIRNAARFLAKSAFVAADSVLSGMPGPRILIYHQIGAGLGRQMEVTEQAFRNQIEWIQANGSVVGLQTAIDQRGRLGSEETFVLTFDDGYRDVYENAWPLLQALGLPFTLYLTTNPVESGKPLTPGGGAEPLTWAQVNEMLESGLMTLGAHTHTHVDLRSVDVGSVREEIERSDELIVMRTGVIPRHFTYPWGYWSEQAGGVIRDTYETATLGSGEPVTADTDPFLVNRIPVQLSDGLFFFKKKMAKGLRLEDKTRRRLTGYTGP